MTESGQAFSFPDSALFRFRQMERAAIDQHKWFLSEKIGKDCGFDFAQWDFIMAGHRARWISGLKERGEYPLG